jgi:hypothetical protein
MGAVEGEVVAGGHDSCPIEFELFRRIAGRE